MPRAYARLSYVVPSTVIVTTASGASATLLLGAAPSRRHRQAVTCDQRHRRPAEEHLDRGGRSHPPRPPTRRCRRCRWLTRALTLHRTYARAGQPITGVVQHYVWGDHDFIPHFLGVEPTVAVGRAVAQTHVNGPATLPTADRSPTSPATAVLLKVLAAANRCRCKRTRTAAAQASYAAGRYPDPEAKPELSCALTPFEAFCGVRPVDATLTC